MSVSKVVRKLSLADFPHSMAVPGRFGDVDARNHMNNIAIAGIFREARTHMIRNILADCRPKGLLFVVLQQAFHYASETHFPGEIDVGTETVDVSRSTIRIGQAMFNDGRPTAAAESVLVGFTGGKSCPLGEAVTDAFLGLRMPVRIAPKLLAD